MSRISMGAADDSMNKDVPQMERPESPKLPPPVSTEWKKVTFQKTKKKFKAKEADPPKLQVEVPSPECQISLEEIVINTDAAPRLTTYKSLQERKNGGNSPEPLPLFDCIFCVGIHEHLVTQTVKEK
jgi:hypothetical protein